MRRIVLFMVLIFISCSIPVVAQTYYFYDTYGKKTTLTLNESKVVVSIPKEYEEISKRIQANVEVLWNLFNTKFDIYFIARSDFEKLTTLDFWEEDVKSVIITPSFFVEDDYLIERGQSEAFLIPNVLVNLKKEENIELLNSYIEKYRLTISNHSSFFPLMYTLALSLDSEKSSLEIANEMFESGDFAYSYPELARMGTEANDPSIIRSITPATTEGSSKIYDLQGRRIQGEPQKGLYIQNGKKIMK